MKNSVNYLCKSCGYKSVKWLGQCPNCKGYSTFEEDMSNNVISNNKKGIKVDLNDIHGYNIGEALKNETEVFIEDRIKTTSEAINNFFGGGILRGSLNLIAGYPGIGKSTFLLSLGEYIPDKKICYISGEESVSQILGRAKRMNGKFTNVTLYFEKMFEKILSIIDKDSPDILIIDSLQLLQSIHSEGEFGGQKQIRYILEQMVSKLKTNNITLFLVGHVTKEGEIGGAMFVEHLVDSVLKIIPAGERSDSLRIIKAEKNRFASTEEILCYEMESEGIKIIDNNEIANYFIEEATIDKSGSVLTCSMVGNQIFLIEIQSLVDNNSFAYPERIINNYNKDKLKNLVKIVNQKYNGSVEEKDIAINIISPFKNNDTPALELPIILSILGNIKNKVFGRKVVIGQVGFHGEIRSIAGQKGIIKKLEKMGFKKEDIISSERYKYINEIV